MTFSQPSFLWALAAMIVPIAIHLLSRREGKVVKVGSLRHMEESNTSRFKSVRLNEVLLLLARCLMILWIALFLSGAACTSAQSGADIKWLVVEKGVEEEPSMKTFVDSLTTSGYEMRYLAEGFPSQPPEDPKHPDYWRLSQRLGSKRNHDIVVIAYNFANGFKNVRPPQPSNVRWISVNPSDKQFVIQARRLTSDTIAVRTGYSDASGTHFTTRRSMTSSGKEWISLEGFADSARIGHRDTIRITVMNDEAYKGDAQLLRAAIRAMSMIPTMIIVEVDSGSDWQFWLREGEPPLSSALNTVVLRPSDAATWLTREGSSVWHLTRRLTPDEALKEHFAVELARMFLSQSETPDGLLAKDVRSLPDGMSWAASVAGTEINRQIQPSDAGVILVILFIVSWISERALAMRKNL